MRRLIAPLVAVGILVIAQGAIVMAAGAPSLASSRPEGPTAGAGGAGPAVGAGTSVDTATDERLDGSAGIAHLASVTAARASADQATRSPLTRRQLTRRWRAPSSEACRTAIR